MGNEPFFMHYASVVLKMQSTRHTGNSEFRSDNYRKKQQSYAESFGNILLSRSSFFLVDKRGWENAWWGFSQGCLSFPAPLMGLTRLSDSIITKSLRYESPLLRLPLQFCKVFKKEEVWRTSGDSFLNALNNSVSRTLVSFLLENCEIKQGKQKGGAVVNPPFGIENLDLVGKSVLPIFWRSSFFVWFSTIFNASENGFLGSWLPFCSTFFGSSQSQDLSGWIETKDKQQDLFPFSYLSVL